MKEVQHHIRKAFVDRLSGNITYDGAEVPVYNKVPSTATEPFIKISSVGTLEVDQNQTKFNTQSTTRIQVFTSFNGDDGGDIQVNSIVDSITQSIRTRSAGYIDLSANNLNVYTTEIEGIEYDEDYRNDKTYHNAVVDVTIKIEQI